jgi:tetratricopeptide (TPR) repeat protein
MMWFPVLVTLLAVPPLVYASILVHELGHAAVGQMVGCRVTSFGLGTAHPLLVLSRRRTRLFLCRTRPFQGITFTYWPQFFPPRAGAIALYSGGILANALALFVSLALYRWMPWGNGIWLWAAVINGVFAATSLIPVSFRMGNATARTDGALILASLLSRSVSLPPPVLIESVAALRGLWDSIGDRVILRVYLLACIGAWIELEDLERAETVSAEAAALPETEFSAHRGLAALLHSSIASGMGRMDDAVEALNQAEGTFRGLDHEAGLFLTDLQRAQLQRCPSDPRERLMALDQLMSRPLVKKIPVLRHGLIEARLLLAADLKDWDLVQRLLVVHEATAARHRWPARALRVYKRVAKLATEQEDWDQAEQAYRKAIAAIDSLASSWSDAADRRRFLERQSGLLQEAQGCLEARNKSEEAHRLVDPLRSAEMYSEQLAEAPHRRDQRLLRIGRRIILANGVTIACLVGIWGILGGKAGIAVGTLALDFVGFTLNALFYLGFHLVIGRRIPVLRTSGGAVTLILACLPWLILVMLPIIVFLGNSR